jgi:23S rRNA pseudouridine1911/1915/1917 synthase
MITDDGFTEYSLIVDDQGDLGRIDKYISTKLNEISRSRVQSLIDDKLILVNDRAVSSSYKVQIGDVIEISVPPPEDLIPQAENIPLDILFEDDDVIVINKRAGMVVHPAVGHATGTLVNALLYHCGDTLSGINGVRRPGIVHRLDKDTSGAMMVAKNDMAHQSLSDQLQTRELSRIYHAICVGVPEPRAGSINAPVGRHPTNRLKQAVTNKNGRDALTHYKVLQDFYDQFALIECKLSTGRTHQIRVHCEYMKHPLIGDPLYGFADTLLESKVRKAGYDFETYNYLKDYPYQALHAHHISFIHPRSGEIISLTAPYSDEFKELYTRLATM